MTTTGLTEKVMSDAKKFAPIFLPKKRQKRIPSVEEIQDSNLEVSNTPETKEDSKCVEKEDNKNVNNNKHVPLAPIFLKNKNNKHVKSQVKTKSKKQKTEQKNSNRKKVDNNKKIVIDIANDDDDGPSVKNNFHFDSDTEIGYDSDATIEYDISRLTRLENEIANNVWSEKYRPKKGSEMIGQEEAVSKLSSFLKDFSKKKKFANEYDDPEFDEATNLKMDVDEWVGADCILVTGRHGAGKTSLVHAVGNDFGKRIFEMNASSKRSGKILMESLHEATQSHHLRGSLSNPVNSIASFFKKVPVSVESTKKTSSISSDTIILLDDVDIVFDQVSVDPAKESSDVVNGPNSTITTGDEGFWRSVRSLIRESKVPVILTATQFIPDILFEKLVDIDVFRIHLEVPVRCMTPIREKLLKVCSLEIPSEEIDNLESQESTQKVNNLVMEKNFDIRHCLNHLQFKGSSFFTSKSDCKKRSTGYSTKKLQKLASNLDFLSFSHRFPSGSWSLQEIALDDLRREFTSRIPLTSSSLYSSQEEAIDDLCWQDEHAAVVSSIIDASRCKPMNHTPVNVCLDLMSYIHEVCVSEEVKANIAREDQVESLKKTRRQSRRRFLHYFDQSNFFLDPPDKIFLREGVYKSFPEREVYEGNETDDNETDAMKVEPGQF